MNKNVPVLIIGCIALILASILSIFVGAAKVAPQEVIEAIFNYDSSISNHNIIIEIRVPRVIAGVFVGASLSVAGAIMQAITRNPIADSGLLGINAGAAFALAICFAFFPGLPYAIIILTTFLGAAVSTSLVFLVTFFKSVKASPVRLVLAGLSVSIFFLIFKSGYINTL